LRPGTPDNLPIIGAGAIDGLIWATGHFRNGILLAPLTAALVLDVLTAARPKDPMLDACDPNRFSASVAGHHGSPSAGVAAAASQAERARAVAGR
jgi:glycine oxidase